MFRPVRGANLDRARFLSVTSISPPPILAVLTHNKLVPTKVHVLLYFLAAEWANAYGNAGTRVQSASARPPNLRDRLLTGPDGDQRQDLPLARFAGARLLPVIVFPGSNSQGHFSDP
jgi:hypothetical protein